MLWYNTEKTPYQNAPEWPTTNCGAAETFDLVELVL